MARIKYVKEDGTVSEVDVANGTSLMLGAVQNNVAGIDGECGGCLSCATCHVYLEEQWVDRVPPADAMEMELLTGVFSEQRPTSRLSCQIVATPELDGMAVHLPKAQA